MSNKIMAMVWEHAHYSGTRKLVLLALADAANQEGLCWPAMRTIARMSECSIRRAREHVTALTDDDWLERQENPGRSNWYLVHMPEKLQKALSYLPSDEPGGEDEGGEISPGSDDETDEGGEISPGYAEVGAEVGEISPGGAAKSRREVGEISPGGRRNLAARTLIEPKENPKRNRTRVRGPSSPSLNEKDEDEAERDDLAPIPPTPLPPRPELSAPRIWSTAVARLRLNGSITSAQLASWILPARASAVAWDATGQLCVALEVPGQAQADMIERKYIYLIREALGSAVGIPQSRVALDVIAVSGVRAVAQ